MYENEKKEEKMKVRCKKCGEVDAYILVEDARVQVLIVPAELLSVKKTTAKKEASMPSVICSKCFRYICDLDEVVNLKEEK
jgi:formylmethanofuran dehydrogenase subunit E